MRRRIALLAALAAPAFAAYTYYYSDTLTTIDTTKWYYNGTLSSSTNGITSGSAGSLISNIAVPDGSSEYEVKMALNLATSGGIYVSFLRASPDALAAGTPSGTYYAVQLKYPTFSGNSCTGELQVYRFLSGQVLSLYDNTSFPCHNGMVIRSVMKGSTIIVYSDNLLVANPSDSGITSGAPGVGVVAAPAANSISRVDLGPLDRVAPNSINPQTIGVLATSTHVDMQWQGVADDANGIGVAYYQVYRGGVFLGGSQTSTFTDATTNPGGTYQMQAVDYHWNVSSVTINAAPSGPDPRRVGVRTTGSYWGGGGENIDVRSGNLNFTLPLLKPQGRGWSVPFNLSYNSQNWNANASFGTEFDWNLGRDSGFGYGWRLQAGSLMPVYSGYWTIDHYLFVDATGAEYRLDQNPGNAGVWSTKESIYVAYDANAGRLYFPDGTFWVFGCTSAGTEPDSGVQYPTLIEDSNGNFITISYQNGVNVSWTNSSARMSQIADVKGPYNFSYSGGHLSTITGPYPDQQYTFTYTPSAPLIAPFSGVQYGNAQMLQQVINSNNTSLSTSFTHDSSGELTYVTFPRYGNLHWGYATVLVSGSSTWEMREVTSRNLTPIGNGPIWSYTITHPNDAYFPFHSTALVTDTGSGGSKLWTFDNNSADAGFGLQIQYEERDNGITKNQANYTWTLDALSRPYIAMTYTTLDPGSNQSQKRTDQVVDQYGNVTSLALYDFGKPNAPASPSRTYTNTYLTGANYAAQHIYNRLTSSTLQDTSGHTANLATNGYDGGVLRDAGGITSHDPAYGTSYTYRGNVTSSSNISGSGSYVYDIAGNRINNTVNGVTTTATLNTNTNYALPSAITTNSLTTTLNWTSFLALNSAQGPNGDTVSALYDPSARPSSTTSPFGAVTTYTYVDNVVPATVTATTNGHWVKSTLDGLGRTIKTETGDAAGTKSVVDTVYSPCGCSPFGKVTQVSQPHAPGATQYWTTYTYDGLGRTTRVQTPDGASATSYVYAANTVTVTDPAGNWKKFTLDGFGNLVEVDEPDPSGTVSTLYTYDVLNHLTQVSMTRTVNGSSVTQTRTFNYTTGTSVGALLLSATNPENGTVTYTYNSDMTVATKTDAKNQQIQYSYDTYKRVVQVRHYPSAGGAEDTTQQVNFSYDTNPYDGGTFSNYTAGRLAAVTYGPMPSAFWGITLTPTFAEWYNYTQAGGVATKRLQMNETLTFGQSQIPRTLNFDAAYTYDGEGKITSVTYPTTFTLNSGNTLTPAPGPTYNYSFDTMSRLSGVTDASNNTLVSGVSYGPANELLGINYLGMLESRTYNSRLQLTNLTATDGIATRVNLQYNYSATNNNGKIVSEVDNVSGEQIQYLYDTLNRLTSAASTTAGTQTYGYDGFGNLTSKVTAIGVNPATNRLTSPAAYDANGNLWSISGYSYGYDVENRTAGITDSRTARFLYAYDAQNKRVWKGTYDMSNGTPNAQEVYFYGIDGKKLATYTVSINQLSQQSAPWLTDSASGVEVYFGSKQVGTGNGSGGTAVIVFDRVGSRRFVQAGDPAVSSFYPYGDDKTSGVPNDQIKFATYTRDSFTGLDYAMNRYYSSAYGRFMTPDPYRATASSPSNPGNPQSWNRYSYVLNDPVNFRDHTGLFTEDTDIVECYDYEDGTFCYSYPSDGGSHGQSAKAKPSKFEKARIRLEDAQDTLDSRTGFDVHCGNDAAALGFNVNQIFERAAGLYVQDGTTSTLPVSSLYGPGAEAAGRAYQAQEDAQYGPGQTISNDFARNPRGLTAKTVLFGNTTYINPDLIGGNMRSNEALLLHEALHALGLTDDYIQSHLSLTVDQNNTKNITDKLYADCVKGKNNF